MSPSRNRQLAVVAVAAVASIAAGAAYAATKLHSSPRGASNALTVGRVFASSSRSTTTPPRFAGDNHPTQPRAGKRRGKVADGTSGKSKGGLIDALVKAETAELDAALKAGTI